jgi:TPR repeat protein
MAPYDIPPGRKYAEVINKAIKGCDCFALLLTNQSQNSIWVAKEVERAVHYRKLLIPICLESVVLNDEFEFYISTDQIVPVKTISTDSAEIQKILQTLSVYVGQSDNNSPVVEGSPVATAAELDPAITDHWEQYKLGFAYEFGQGRPQDYKLAVKWYLLAANQENSWAQNRLGDCYYAGHGVEQNYETAVEYLFKADAAGDTDAVNTLSFLFGMGQGFDQTEETTFNWYLFLAKKGDANAQNNVGLSYATGRGVAPDDNEAIFWFRKAAECGCADAIKNLRLLGVSEK